MDEGDEVLVPDPYFVMYKHLVNLLGGKPVFVDTYPDFRLRREALEEKVTGEAIAELIIHPRGMAKGTPSHSTIIPFLNKADIPGGLEKGRELAQRILEKGHPKIKRVVLGNALRDRPVVEVLTRKKDS